MATLFVDKLDPQSGTALEIGSSGDTITIPSVATLTNNGTATGFGGDNTPMFLASGGSGNQTINDASYTKVEYNQEIIDTDSAFDLSNNKFTVPTGEAGKYQFHAQYYVEDAGKEIRRLIGVIFKNGSAWRYDQLRVGTNNAEIMAYSMHMNAIDDSIVGDYYEVYLYQETDDNSSLIIENSSTTYSNNWFQGYKLIG